MQWKELASVTDPETALDEGTPVIHPDLGDNLCWQREFSAGEVDAVFENADAVVEEVFEFGRHTGVTVEPRSILADYDPAEARLTVRSVLRQPVTSSGLRRPLS